MAQPNDVMERIANSLDLVVRIMLEQTTAGKTSAEQIELLSTYGLGPTQIAAIVGTSVNTVNVTLSRLRKAKKVAKKDKG